MLSFMNRTVLVSLGIGIAVALFAGSAFGTVADYNSFVQSHSDTIICYDFEGTSAAQQQQNKAGTTNASLNDLVEVTLRDGGGEGNITYTPGFDATSTAFVPYGEGTYVGKVFSTGNPLPLTNTVSYEAIIRQNTSGWEYLVASFNKSGVYYRGYFTVQDGNDDLTAKFGSGEFNTSFGLIDSVGDWCYVAVSANYDSSWNETDYTVYSANLTDGDTTLSSVSDIGVGSFLTGTAFGIGGLSVNGIAPNEYYQEASNAQMDQVVFYNGVKDAAFFQANLDRILAGGSPDIPGDANRDSKVDGSDVTILAGNWQAGVTGEPNATWDMGDFNGDGKVDGSDVTILAGNWQAGVETAATSVPEPSMLVLLILGGLALCFGRHGR